MPNRRPKSCPSWTDVKARLMEFDRPGLLDLIHDLYDGLKDNQAFLHARFGLGENVLGPYKKTIDRWIAPDVFSNQPISISKAKAAISNYKTAIGDPQGLAELMVFFCESATDFCNQFGNDDVPYYNALVHMFEEALKIQSDLPSDLQKHFLGRLERVRDICHNFGYGVGDDMDFLLSQYDGSAKPNKSH